MAARALLVLTRSGASISRHDRQGFLIDELSKGRTIPSPRKLTGRPEYPTTAGPFSNGIAPVDDDPDGLLLEQALQERHNTNLARAFEGVTYFDDELAGGYTAYSLGPFHPLIIVPWNHAGHQFYDPLAETSSPKVL